MPGECLATPAIVRIGPARMSRHAHTSGCRRSPLPDWATPTPRAETCSRQPRQTARSSRRRDPCPPRPHRDPAYPSASRHRAIAIHESDRLDGCRVDERYGDERVFSAARRPRMLPTISIVPRVASAALAFAMKQNSGAAPESDAASTRSGSVAMARRWFSLAAKGGRRQAEIGLGTRHASPTYQSAQPSSLVCAESAHAADERFRKSSAPDGTIASATMRKPVPAGIGGAPTIAFAKICARRSPLAQRASCACASTSIAPRNLPLLWLERTGRGQPGLVRPQEDAVSAWAGRLKIPCETARRLA